MQFPGKILLFGEHTVIKGSEALAIPLWNLSGRWCKSKNEIAAARLTGLINYLEKLKLEHNFPIEIERLKRDVFENKFWYESDIPEGYGAGSSGALVAAIY